MNGFAAVTEALRRADNFLLVTHFNPDGDALGSLLGLADILEGLGKRVLRFLEEPVSPLYRFLPGCAHVQTDWEKVEDFTRLAQGNLILVCLDCGDEHRLGRFKHELMAIKPLIVIDHHQGNNGFGDGSWIEPHRSSTGEMIFDLARALAAEISPKAAECLYAAISTDTGSFKYDSTSHHTFAVAGELVKLGVRPASVASNLFDNYSLGRVRLMQEVLATLEMHERDRIAIIRVTQNMLERTFTTMEDTEYFINFPRAIRSVRVAVFLKEIGTGYVSVSLRSKGQCDVAQIAGGFGGGGHRNASGFRVRGVRLDTLRDELLPMLAEAMQP